MDREKSLEGISDRERATMRALLKMRPEPQKTAPKPVTPKGIAQRRRRARERLVSTSGLVPVDGGAACAGTGATTDGPAN